MEINQIEGKEENDTTIKDSNIASFDEVAAILDYEKSSKTIDNELNSFSGFNEKVVVEKVEEKVEGKKGFSLNDLNNPKPYTGNDISVSSEVKEEEKKEDLEDYMDSAEFIIFIIELVIVWSTNFYLKQHELDTISKKEFEVTAREQKMLIKSWAKILRKYSIKVGVELELLFAMGSAYGMKVKGIVKRQEERKLLELKENKNKKEPRIEDIKDIKDIEEIKDNEELKKKRKKSSKNKGFSLDKSKKITQEDKDPKEGGALNLVNK